VTQGAGERGCGDAAARAFGCCGWAGARGGPRGKKGRKWADGLLGCVEERKQLGQEDEREERERERRRI